jgi:hypothetical protein
MRDVCCSRTCSCSLSCSRSALLLFPEASVSKKNKFMHAHILPVEAVVKHVCCKLQVATCKPLHAN